VLGVMNNGKEISGVIMQSRIVMWVTWQCNTCHIDTWLVDTWPSIGGTYQSCLLVSHCSAYADVDKGRHFFLW
jgi:hypothetical protein